MRLHALIVFLLFACACEPPPFIALRVGPILQGTVISAAVSQHGTPFSGSVDFAASRGEIRMSRIACDENGNASTLLSASPGPIT